MSDEIRNLETKELPNEKEDTISIHEKNFQKLHNIYYEKELAYSFDKYMSELNKDDSLDPAIKLKLKLMFEEYYNSRINTGIARKEDLKAIDMFNVYKRNGKPISYSFFTDISLASILRSKKLITTFMDDLSNTKIAKMYYNYWLYFCKRSLNEGMTVDSILPTIRKNMYDLVTYEVIKLEVYNALMGNMSKEIDNFKKNRQGGE